ncbi:MAG: lipoate--protein ligase [Bacteroidetes bacterium]|nr:lipoate--protein ligase [Bacteroidota bacterium]
MRFIQNTSTNPYFNLALEEYILKEFSEDYFLIYRNEPSVIIGKHQNALAEINIEFVNKNKIKVARRLSGGGAVFHDLGNLNYTFITNGEKANLVNFKKFSQPIIDILNKIGVPAELEGKSDLKIHGLKFSGNAEHVYKNRVLHHGTMLFSSDISNLGKALADNSIHYIDNAVKSNRSEVTNIMNYLSSEINISDFEELIIGHINYEFLDFEEYFLTENDYEKIEILIDQKYSQWEWNYGYSPNYTFNKKLKKDFGSIEIYLGVEKGIIVEANIETNILNLEDSSKLEERLIGSPHSYSEVLTMLISINRKHALELVKVFF